MDVLELRGFPAPELDALRAALAGLSDEEHEGIRKSLERTRMGCEPNEDTQIAQTLGRGARQVVMDRVIGHLEAPGASAGMLSDEGEALRWMLANPDWESRFDQLELGEQDAPRSSDGDAAQEEGERREERSMTLAAAKGTDAKRRAGDSGKAPSRVEARHLGAFADPHEGPGRDVRPGGGLDVHKVLGTSGKIHVEMDIASGAQDERRRFTVRIEAANRPKFKGDESAASRRSMEAREWQRKIIFQLTIQELHEALATLLGARESCSFRSHGKDNDKRCEIRTQPGGVVVAVSQGSRSIAVPVDGVNLYPLTVILCRALFMNDADIDQKVLLDLVRLTAKSHRDGQARGDKGSTRG